MAKDMRKVIGSYNNRESATSEINRLMEEGYNREAITLYTGPTQSNQFRVSQDADNETENVREDAKEVIDQGDIRREENDSGIEEVGQRGIGQEDVDEVAREEERTGDYESTSDRVEDEDNRSFVDDLADMFTLDVYDYEDESKNPNYDPDEDLLYPYREDIAKGNSVIVVDNYRGHMI